jgi:hypothetical protein
MKVVFISHLAKLLAGNLHLPLNAVVGLYRRSRSNVHVRQPVAMIGADPALAREAMSELLAHPVSPPFP